MEKTIAIFADIHANIDALDAVMKDARAQGATDHVCIGDVVGYNAAPNECLDAVRKLCATTIRGNHDHYCSNDERLEDFHPLAANVVSWTRKQLGAERQAWLRALPLHAFHQGITLVHSTLDMPERWGYVFEEIEAEAHFSYQNTQVCFNGHTHVPVYFEKRGAVIERKDAADIQIQLGRKYFINTGSVGQPRDSDPRASYCLYEVTKRLIRFRRVEYDIAA
ncbi:MAG: metallophosphatase family protein, partial [Kiritimatiellaeota bacterium]|nr:metallophosphatase family protein [Kiritimatiellota bacterium]